MQDWCDVTRCVPGLPAHIYVCVLCIYAWCSYVCLNVFEHTKDAVVHVHVHVHVCGGPGVDARCLSSVILHSIYASRLSHWTWSLPVQSA